MNPDESTLVNVKITFTPNKTDEQKHISRCFGATVCS